MGQKVTQFHNRYDDDDDDDDLNVKSTLYVADEDRSNLLLMCSFKALLIMAELWTWHPVDCG